MLRSITADGLPLYVGEAGPTISRAHAIEFSAGDVEWRRASAAYVFNLEVEVVEVERLG